jgi:hypothetical protein
VPHGYRGFWIAGFERSRGGSTSTGQIERSRGRLRSKDREGTLDRSTAEGGCATKSDPKGLGVNKRDSPLISEASTVDKGQQLAVSLKGSSPKVVTTRGLESRKGLGVG